jgi:hypothetical protein
VSQATRLPRAVLDADITLLLQQTEKLITREAGTVDDLVQRALGQVAAVHRDDDPARAAGVSEDVMAALDSIELPACAFQRPSGLLRRNAR